MATSACRLLGSHCRRRYVRSRAAVGWARLHSSQPLGFTEEDVTTAAPEPFPLSGYLNKVLNARVYDVAVETPLQPAVNLSSTLQNTVLLKVSPCVRTYRLIAQHTYAPLTASMRLSLFSFQLCTPLAARRLAASV